MTPQERRKAIDTAIAAASGNTFVPAAVKVGLAAMAEELRALSDRIAELEKSPAFKRVGV